MAAQGRQSATLRGVVSSVQMVERPEPVPTTFRPLHWLRCEAPHKLCCPRPPKGVWAEEDTFRSIAVGGPADGILTAVAALAAAHCSRVSEAASLRLVDLETLYRITFYDYKVRDQYVTAHVGAWGEAWRRRLRTVVAHRPKFLPVFPNSDALQDALRRRLLGTHRDAMGWQGCKRCGAAAMAAAGAHIRAIAIWSRLSSKQQATEYAGAPPDGAWGAPPMLPWPGSDVGVQCRATGVMDMWPRGTILGMADSTAPKRGERGVSGRKPELYIIFHSSDSSDVPGSQGSAATALRVSQRKPKA